MRILKKISAKNIMGKIPVPQEGETIDLFQVYGHASKCESIDTSYGVAIKIIGQFEAFRADTGELFRSPTLYLPRPADEMIEEALSEAEGQVEFGFEISVVKADTKTGYEYLVSTIVEPEGEDPLVSLRSKFTETKMLEKNPEDNPEDRPDETETDE